MGLFMVRLFGLGGSLLCAYLMYDNWQRALTEHEYSLRITAIAPIMLVFGLYVMLFPTKVGRPETTLDKIVTFVLVLIGAAGGAYYWYLLDPANFDFLLK